MMLVDASAPLPPATTTPRRSRPIVLASTQHCDEPLQRFRVVLEGTAAGARRPLRRRCAARPGEPVEIALDLTWETDGIPYQWRLATRYEIPCRVTGTVRIGEETDRAQRPRPARPLLGRARLVGERLDVERPAPRRRHPHARGHASRPMPGFGVGYVQRGDELTELSAISSTARSPRTG